MRGKISSESILKTHYKRLFFSFLAWTMAATINNMRKNMQTTPTTAASKPILRKKPSGPFMITTQRNY